MQPKLHEGGAPNGAPSLVPIVKSKRWDACLAVYLAMEEGSQPDYLIENYPDGTVIRVWRGYIGDLVAQHGFTRSKGTHVVKDLERMGAVEVRARGKSGKPSEIVLIQPPTKEKFASTRDTLYMESREEARFSAEQAAKLELLERVKYLEETTEAILEKLQRHQQENHG